MNNPYKNVSKSDIKGMVTGTEFNFCGYWDGFYHFVEGNYREGFYHIKCKEKDLLNGNILEMIKLGVTL